MKKIFFTKKHYISALILSIFILVLVTIVISLWTLPSYTKYSKSLESFKVKESKFQQNEKLLESLKKEKTLQDSDTILLNGKIGNGLNQTELISKINDLVPEDVQLTAINSNIENEQTEKKKSSDKKSDAITGSKKLPSLILWSCSMSIAITSDSEKGIIALINKLETNEQFFEVDKVSYESSSGEMNNYSAVVFFKYYYISNLGSKYSVQPGI